MLSALQLDLRYPRLFKNSGKICDDQVQSSGAQNQDCNYQALCDDKISASDCIAEDDVRHGESMMCIHILDVS